MLCYLYCNYLLLLSTVIYLLKVGEIICLDYYDKFDMSISTIKSTLVTKRSLILNYTNI